METNSIRQPKVMKAELKELQSYIIRQLRIVYVWMNEWNLIFTFEENEITNFAL